MHLLFYNKNNEIVVKLNDNTLAKKIKKQAPKKVAYKIDAYLIENNITTTKVCVVAQTLPSGDIVIQTTNKETAEKLKREDGWKKVLRCKAKLAWKQYRIVALGISIAKIDLKKAKETKEKIVAQNASMCASMKIESILWLFALKKNRRTSLLVIKVDNAKMANILIEKRKVLDHILHGCMR